MHKKQLENNIWKAGRGKSVPIYWFNVTLENQLFSNFPETRCLYFNTFKYCDGGFFLIVECYRLNFFSRIFCSFDWIHDLTIFSQTGCNNQIYNKTGLNNSYLYIRNLENYYPLVGNLCEFMFVCFLFGTSSKCFQNYKIIKTCNSSFNKSYDMI